MPIFRIVAIVVVWLRYRNKLNRLYTRLAPGTPLTSEDLAALGISADLAVHYVRAGWLHRLARGVYCRPNDTLPCTPACSAAAQVRGVARRRQVGARLVWRAPVPVPTPVLHLYGWTAARLPDWFTQRFPAEYHRKRLFKEQPDALLTSRRSRTPGAPQVSAPERALLEVLSEVGVRQPLQEARELVESTYSLRADVLRDLLQRCTSVKTVRLCLQLGRELSLPWAAKLDPRNCLPEATGPGYPVPAKGSAGAQAMNQVYLDTARLLTQVAPLVFVDDTFALKGGTAINLFVRDMPRLSVDLDLVFPDYALPREQALQRINEAIRQSAERLQREASRPMRRPGGRRRNQAAGAAWRHRGQDRSQLRDARHRPSGSHGFSDGESARDAAGGPRNSSRVSGGHVRRQASGGMDRQHPRDLFDAMRLFAHEGITDGIRRAFVVYLACHNRPVHEVFFHRYTTSGRNSSTSSQG